MTGRLEMLASEWGKTTDRCVVLAVLMLLLAAVLLAKDLPEDDPSLAREKPEDVPRDDSGLIFRFEIYVSTLMRPEFSLI